MKNLIRTCLAVRKSVYNGWVFSVLMPLLLLTSNSIYAHPAQDLVENLTERVFVAVRSASDSKGVDLFEDDILKDIDFKRMTANTVGHKTYKSATTDQRRALVNAYRDMLINAFGTTLFQFADFKMQALPFDGDSSAKVAMVKTVFEDPGSGKAYKVNYATRSTKHGWRIFDLSVDGVSVLIGNKSLFKTELQKGGIDGLIKKLENKNKEK